MSVTVQATSSSVVVTAASEPAISAAISGSSVAAEVSPVAPSTVPGAPTILVAGYDEETSVGFTPPSDGGSPITAYKFLFDGVELTPNSTTQTSASFAVNLVGQEVEVSAVNAIGEGPKSAPLTVTAA